MEQDFYFIELFEIYGGLLTENQRSAFYSHYCLDLSLAEIASNTGTGRQSVYETVKSVKAKLEEYEKILHLKEKFTRLNEIAAETSDKKTGVDILSVIGE